MNVLRTFQHVASGILIAPALTSPSAAQIAKEFVTSEVKCSDEEFLSSIDQIDLPSGYLRIWDGQPAKVLLAERVRGSCAKLVHNFFASGINLKDGRVFYGSRGIYYRGDPRYRGPGLFRLGLRLGSLITLSPLSPEMRDRSQQVFVRTRAKDMYVISEAVVFGGKVTQAPPLLKLADRVVAVTEFPAYHGNTRRLHLTVERSDDVLGLTWSSTGNW